MLNNPFEALVLEGATKAEVKAKWRELVMTLHPDKGGNVVEFMEVRDAYNKALSTAPERRVCLTCNGSGTRQVQSGFSVINQVCTTCMGEGHQ